MLLLNFTLSIYHDIIDGDDDVLCRISTKVLIHWCAVLMMMD